MTETKDTVDTAPNSTGGASAPPVHLIQDDDDQTVCCLRAWAEMTDGLTYEVDAVTCKGNAGADRG